MHVISSFVGSNFVGKQRKKKGAYSDSSTISSEHINSIMESLRWKSTKSSTAKNYHSIWREFNQFLIRLDRKPQYWEDRVALFCTYLVDKGRKSSTIRSYISAIKKVLKTDGYPWNDGRVELTALTNACKLINDVVKTRLPINCKLLGIAAFQNWQIVSNSTLPECFV